MNANPKATRRFAMPALALLFGGAALLAMPVLAQDSEAPSAPPALAGGIAFSAIDADGDGVITAEEWAAFVEARHAMTPEERREARARMMAERIVAEFDQDGDGLLSAEELAGLPALMRTQMQQHRGGHSPRMWGGRHSQAEGSGRMGRPAPERGAMRGRIFGGGMDAEHLFERIDTDGDGQISLPELEAAMERMGGTTGSSRSGGPDGPRGGQR